MAETFRARGSRRQFLTTTLAGAATVGLLPALSAARESAPSLPQPQVPAFELDEIDVAGLQDAMASSKYSALALTEKYSARIEAFDQAGPAVNSVIEMNPDAASIAASLDRERKSGKVRGPLHGIPVL